MRDQMCTVHGKMLFSSLGTKALSAAVFMSRVSASLAPEHQLLPLLALRGKVLQFAPIWNQKLSQRLET